MSGPVAYIPPPSFGMSSAAAYDYVLAPHAGSPMQVPRQLSRGPGPMPHLLAGAMPQAMGPGCGPISALGSEQAMLYQQQQQQQQQPGRHVVQPPYDTTSTAPWPPMPEQLAAQASHAQPPNTMLWLQPSAQTSQPSLVAQAAAIPAAGASSASQRHAEMPRLGRGLYYSSAMSGHLELNEAGVAGVEVVSPQGKGHGAASPAAGSRAGSFSAAASPGARAGQRGGAFAAGFGDQGDALDSFQAQANNRHAGKATASSLSFSDTPAGAASPPARAAPPAPWEVPQAPLQSGVRTFHSSAAKADNLSNGEAGIYGPEGSQARVRGPGLAPGDQLGGLSRMGSGGTGKGPLAFGFEADSYLAPRHLGAHAGARSHSNLRQMEAGLVQEGHDVQGQKAYAGKTQASQLQFAEGGIHRPQQFAPPATHAHAGKITASSLMPGEFGISGSAKPYARNPSSGEWSTSYDNAYRP